MDPMNKFLTTATPEFRKFIDDICAVNSAQASSANLEAQYVAPNQIKGRLPPAAREGLPSLPFLLDSTKLLAELVELWTKHAPRNLTELGVEQALGSFHGMAVGLSQKTRECLSSAEQAEKPDGKLESKWQQILKDQQKSRNVFDEHFATPSSNDPDLTALPQRDVPYVEHPKESEDIQPSSATARDKKAPLAHRGNENKIMNNSTNSSTASFEVIEEKQRTHPPSRDGGGGKNRLFDLMSSSGRRKGRDRNHGPDDGNEF